MDEDAVSEYVERTESIIEGAPQMDEANTKAAVLRDFLGLLGWEIPGNTQLEYSVKAFGKTYKVDYALVLEGAPVAFLEAKGVDTPLADTHREQLAAYLKNEDVNLGILTNVEEYEFFRRQVVDGKVEVNKLGGAVLEDLNERLPILKAFRREAIQGDEWSQILDRIDELREARYILEDRKDELSVELAGILVTEVSEKIDSHVESEAKEMVDRVIEDIETEINAERVESLSSSPEVEQSAASNAVEAGDGVIELSNDGNTLAILGGDSQTDAMANAVDYLLENHGLIHSIEPLPYVPGRSKAVINDEPTSPHDEQAMRNHRKLSGGYYLDTHMNKDRKEVWLREMADMCELEVSFRW